MDKVCVLIGVFSAVFFVHATIPGFQLPGSQQNNQDQPTTAAPQGSQFQVNIKFIPAIRLGSCNFGSISYPLDVECGMCFCLTGAFSRCVPRPGCVIGAANATTTKLPLSAANVKPTTETAVLPEKPDEENEVDTEKPATEKPTGNRRRNKFIRS